MSVIVPSQMNVTLILDDESELTVNMLRLLVQAQNAEFKAKHGMFLPSVGKLRPTVRKLREEYPMITARTWDEAAVQLREMHSTITEAISNAR